MFWIDDICAALRAQVGVWDFPGWDGTLTLALSLAPGVRLHFISQIGRAWCRHWYDGTTTIWAPEGDAELLAHELGHAVLTNGLAGVVQFSDPRLADLQQTHEEAVARYFARAWLLPRELCRCNLTTVWEESGCSPELLRQRMGDFSQP